MAAFVRPGGVFGLREISRRPKVSERRTSVDFRERSLSLPAEAAKTLRTPLAAALTAAALFASPAPCATLQAQFSVGITIVASPCAGSKAVCDARSSLVAAPAATAPSMDSYTRQADGILVWTRTY